jgi:D-lyxose ketol-isomerase
MKRSRVNEAIKWAEELCQKHNVTLPVFANFAPDKAEFAKPEYENIVKTMLGWDVSDFGLGDFETHGAVLFTVRNGSIFDSSVGTPYAEKYIMMKEGKEQEIPMHYHIHKTEDIINRAGGILCVQLYMEGADGQPDPNQNVVVYCDGIRREVKGGTTLEISTGNSITLTPHMYHRFYAKTGFGDLLVGEVSKINDDNTDNVFPYPQDRFCEIEEDEAPYRLLVNEY